MPDFIGPVMLDLAGTELSQEEQELLQHPRVGGVVLFARNYSSLDQLKKLTHSIRAARSTPLLIAVDQEGGRVQRFKFEFSRLPSMGEIGKLYQESPTAAVQFAESCAGLMATELLAAGVDLSFAPVLDLDKKLNTVIGDRGFAADPLIVTRLAHAFMRGMHTAGMAATGKHFPGHGSVTVDSHLALPCDERDFNTIYQEDLQPFIQLIRAGIDAIMPAHIVFTKMDTKAVGFSQYWLQDVLRKQLNFTGIIFSDDLNMQAAESAGGYAERAEAAARAGCDLLLICNNRAAAIAILEQLPAHYALAATKFQRLQGKFTRQTSLANETQWKNFYRKIYAEKNEN